MSSKPAAFSHILTGALLCSVMLANAEEQLQSHMPAGKTIMARGDVAASAGQQSRPLQRLSPVYPVDLITTGAASSSQLRMSDGGLLSMQAESALAISQYQADPATGRSDVSMELLKGGLRTITGTLPAGGKNYQLNTPVASIGVRGTHYEAMLRQGDLYLAGWDGIIDVKVTVPGAGQQFSLGPSEPYRFAIVRADGSVELLLRAPAQFATAQALTFSGEPVYRDQFGVPAATDPTSSGPRPRNLLTTDAGGRDIDNNDRLTADWSPQPMDNLGRSGTVSFNQLESHSFSSSAGELSDLSMSMQVNFDAAWVPAGQLSFTDSAGEWFAVFSGVFGDEALSLNITSASHGNQPADGNIGALFIRDAGAVLGTLQLFEQDNPAVRLEGGFVLSEQP